MKIGHEFVCVCLFTKGDHKLSLRVRKYSLHLKSKPHKPKRVFGNKKTHASCLVRTYSVHESPGRCAVVAVAD